MLDGFEVDPTALSTAAGEITRCMAPARSIDLEVLPGGPETCGHPAASEALAHFCTTWQLATQLLVARADSKAQGLIEQAAEYLRTDTAAGDQVGRLHAE